MQKLTRAEFKPIAQMTLALWVGTSLFWAVPDLVRNGEIPLQVAIGILFDISCGLTLSGLFLLVMLRLRGRSWFVRRLAVALVAIGFAIIHSYFDAEVMLWLDAASGFSKMVANIFASILIDYMLIYALFATAVSLLLSQFELRQRDLRLAAAETGAQRAQLAALRHQLNPHFMFNTLNAIGALVGGGRGTEAEAMIGRLSDFMRSALATDSSPFHLLDEEIELIETYLEIEQVRFGERLKVRIAVEPGLGDAPVPTFLLQPLVENAVKHAVAPALRPVLIEIAVRREDGMLRISVADDGAGSGEAKAAAGTGTGLRNLRERLALLYGGHAALETSGGSGEGFRAELRLPLGSAEGE